MPIDSEFKRAIEDVKLRTSLEEVVRERVPELRKRGRLWEACCPFHDERTPSFKVDPARGTWRCYGACQKGGDVISFVQESQNLDFREALELLAARTGVELPRRRGRAEAADHDPGLAALGLADDFFQRELRSGEGRAAREYLQRRGIALDTQQAFGLGYAPRVGQALVGLARRVAAERRDLSLDVWERAGLLRRAEDGRPYAFFRGRLTIPIRDVKGRTVGFGARRLEASDGPKYVNTPETPWFTKGRVVYALDRAIDHVRRGGHLVLVEGYTDVIAAHQAGLPMVCAVLGTSTTEDHARLVRRAGARRVTLVFDGDEAGRRGAWRALHGLLPLDVELDVVALPRSSDPADLLAAEGREGFAARLEGAQPWFDFARAGLEGCRGKALADAVDPLLELLDRLPKPVHRESLLATLAEGLGMPVETVREQWRALPQRRRAAAQAAAQAGSQAGSQAGRGPRTGPSAPRKRVDRRTLQAYKAAAGAVLADPGLVPRVRPWIDRCPSEGLRAILASVAELFETDDAVIDASNVMTALGEHPVREHVVSLLEHARSSDYPPHQLLDEALRTLAEIECAVERARLTARVAELEPVADAGDEAAARDLEGTYAQLSELHRRGPQESPLGR